MPSSSTPTPLPTSAIIGAGSIGSVIAAWLFEAGHDVRLCARSPFDQVEILRRGERTSYAIPTSYDTTGLAPVDVIFVTTKAQQIDQLADWFDALVGPQTVVVVVQNGVRHAERFAGILPEEQIIPAVVYIGAERLGPGRVEHRVGNRLLVQYHPKLDVVRAATAGSGLDVRLEEDFTTVAWKKLLGNVGANPVTALTLGRAELMADSHVRPLVIDMLREAVAVGRAEGADLDEGDVDEILAFYDGLPAGSGTSMLYDRLADRHTEHEFITGAVVEAGDRHGIATPANDVVLALMRGLDRRLDH